MKNILYAISLLVLFIAFLPSCHSLFNKEDKINDYLPLKVGAKYKYKYSDSYRYLNEKSITKGECTWNFIGVSVDTPVIYQVEESFNGYYVVYDYGIPKDSTAIVNQISTLKFEVQNDGKVAFSGTGTILERFIQSDREDTCFRSSHWEQACLRKNVGITSCYVFPMHGNHVSSVSYYLIEGPYY